MPYYIKNTVYWFDDSVMKPNFTHLDQDIFSGLDQLRGEYTVPNYQYYYWGVSRLNQLNNSNYMPNNPYAYSKIFTTQALAQPVSNIWLSDNVDYDHLTAAVNAIHNATGVALGNIGFCLLSVKIGELPASHRNYYLEVHITPYSWTGSGTNTRCSASIYTRVRLEDYDTDTNTYVLIEKISGQAVYQSGANVRKMSPIFSSWYNGDKNEPHVVYFFGFWVQGSTVYDGFIPMETGADITNNSHTFKQLAPTLPTGHNVKYYEWDSNAYKQLNPTTDVSFDDLVLEMGPFGPESDRDGYPTGVTPGHGDDSSDTIDIPDDPLIGVTNVGFVNVYKTGAASLQNMGVELFPDLQYTNPTPISGSAGVVESIEAGFNSIITALANIPSIVAQQVAATLINYIIDCHVIPVDPGNGTSENIKVGYKQLTVTGERLSNDYVPFDCGTINIGEYYGSFADHAATSAKLFLPFVGFVPVRTEWFYNDTLGVKYKFNIIDGSFVAYVTSTGKYTNNGNGTGTVVAQYSGNACVHLPITGVTYSSMVSGLVGSSAGAITAAGSGNIAGVASSVDAAASVKGDIPQSNGYASSGAFLSVRRPYLMIERVVTNYSPTFRKERGLPSNISMKLQNMAGFTILQDVHLDSITATDAEKKELEGLLSKGVIF